MARIVCVTGGLTGLLHATLELARRLTAAGHQVTMACSPRVRGTVEAAGVPVVPVDTDGFGRFLDADGTQPRWRRLWTLRQRRAAAARAMETAAVSSLIDALTPDLVLVDVERHAAILATLSSNIPCGLLVPFVSIWRCPGLPPPHHLVRPGIGFRGSRMGIRLLWLNLRLRRMRVAARDWFRHAGCDLRSVLRDVAREVGVDLARRADASQWLIPFTYRDVPALCLHAREFEFPHDPPSHVHYTGPLIARRDVARTPEAVRSALAAIVDRRRTTPGRRLIYAGFGSFFSATPDLIQHLFDAVAPRPDWELLLSLGGTASALADTVTQPPNVSVLPWVPQVDVLAHADVAVIHGGIGTVDECVAAGVPMLVYCGGQTDMGGTTARVWHHGLGVPGDRDRDTPEVIRRRLEGLLDSAAVRRRLDTFRRVYASYETERVAERVVENLLAARATPPDAAGDTAGGRTP